MLRGTNSMDKYLGSKAIIEKLIHEKGVGMVATHDLKLSELSDEYPLIIKNYHFDIKVEGEEMLFDYKLKTGPCTTFNASLLLKKIGIEI
jgi:DNA mismatch repair ATPase MutS